MAAQSRPAEAEVRPEATLPIPPALLRELLDALRSIRYGAIELAIHDGRVVQLERREKVRFDLDVSPPRREPSRPGGHRPA
jgi:hypothetical protein